MSDAAAQQFLEQQLIDVMCQLPGADSTAEERRAATVDDPLKFALVYLMHHMKAQDTGQITLSYMHLHWRTLADRLKFKKQSRDSVIAPRDSGKSTWWFLFIPLWAAAHGYSKFTAAFADSGGQAEIHLLSFKHELDTNELLRNDFPDLCRAMKRTSTGGNVADNSSLMVCANGFVFKAAGIDASNLGLKVNEMRPDFIIFDDIEPDESGYSTYQAKKRLGTVTDAVLPMNIKARVVFTGTVTMPGGITHQLVQSVTGGSVGAQWIQDERVHVHYYPPVLQRPDGSECSIWPAKWPLDYLTSIQHTRSYAKNFKNLPIATDGDYWREADFQYGCPAPLTHTMLSIDPAVTTKRTSDFTGMAVVSYKPRMRDATGPVTLNGTVLTKQQQALPACVVHEAIEVKMSGEFLREKALKIITDCEETDHPIRLLYVEVNQGGDLWLQVFHDMPVPVEVVSQSVKKEVRAAKLLSHYQRERVWHAVPLPAAEEQMMGYPDVLHDDMIDAIGTAVGYYARKAGKKRDSNTNRSVAYAR